MKIAIVGSRNFKDAYVRVRKCLLKCKGLYGDKIIILTGGGGRVDNVAISEAIDLGLRVIIIPAQWNKLGASAGPIRNTSIVKQSDLIYAFWNGTSRGTADVVRKA